MRLSSLPVLVEWQLQMLGPTAAAASTASVPVRPSVMRLESRSVCARLSLRNTCVRMNASSRSLTWKLCELS